MCLQLRICVTSLVSTNSSRDIGQIVLVGLVICENKQFIVAEFICYSVGTLFGFGVVFE